MMESEIYYIVTANTPENTRVKLYKYLEHSNATDMLTYLTTNGSLYLSDFQVEKWEYRRID